LSSSTLVPDLVGLPSTEARRLARQSRFTLEVLERGTSEGLWGCVLEQAPVPGASLDDSTAVSITVGARPHVTVPDLRGREEEEALSMLREAGLGAARRNARRSDRVPDGCIVRTRPRAGASLPMGSRVSYVVATGTREVDSSHKRVQRRARVGRLPDGSFLSLPEPRGGPRR
jgi:serine/threonine-protein kinase